MKDAEKLGQIYLTLVEQSADLFVIMERHPFYLSTSSNVIG